MKFTVKLTEEAKKDFISLTDEQKDLLQEDYEIIRTVDLDAVNFKPLDKNLFEIKTKNLRSLFDYRKGQLIIVAVIYVKQSQKAPKQVIERAKKILKRYE